MAFKLPAIYNSLFFCLQFQLAFQLPTIYNQLAFNKTTSNGIQIAYNLQSVALCLQFQMALKLPAIHNSLFFAYNYNWHSNCLQFTINLFFAYNFKWHSNCLQFTIRCFFAYNFNWHSNCLQFTINLLLTKLLQMAFKLPAICNSLLFSCLQFQLAFQLTTSYNQLALSKSTTTTGIQIARNLQFVCSLPTISTGIQMPAICNSFALCLPFQLAYKLPAICNPLLFAYNFNWHVNCLQFAIHCSLPTTSPGI